MFRFVARRLGQFRARPARSKAGYASPRIELLESRFAPASLAAGDLVSFWASIQLANNPTVPNSVVAGISQINPATGAEQVLYTVPFPAGEDPLLHPELLPNNMAVVNGKVFFDTTVEGSNASDDRSSIVRLDPVTGKATEIARFNRESRKLLVTDDGSLIDVWYDGTYNALYPNGDPDVVASKAGISRIDPATGVETVLIIFPTVASGAHSALLSRGGDDSEIQTVTIAGNTYFAISGTTDFTAAPRIDEKTGVYRYNAASGTLTTLAYFPRQSLAISAGPDGALLNLWQDDVFPPDSGLIEQALSSTVGVSRINTSTGAETKLFTFPSVSATTPFPDLFSKSISTTGSYGSPVGMVTVGNGVAVAAAGTGNALEYSAIRRIDLTSKAISTIHAQSRLVDLVASLGSGAVFGWTDGTYTSADPFNPTSMTSGVSYVDPATGVETGLYYSPTISGTSMPLYSEWHAVQGPGSTKTYVAGISGFAYHSGELTNASVLLTISADGKTATPLYSSYGKQLGGVVIVPPPVNNAPTISDTATRTTTLGKAIATIGITVGDAETSAGQLKVSASSSNTTLLPTAGITLGGSGAYRTVSIAPAAGTVGTSVVTLTVTDANGKATTDTFSVIVNPTTMPASARSLAVGTGPGGTPMIQLRNPANGMVLKQETVGDAASRSGVRVATADVTGDGVPDLFVGTGPGVSNQASLYDGVTLKKLRDVPSFEPSFTGGIYVAAGDVTGDGVPELIVAAGEGGGPRVRVTDGKSGIVLADFFAINDPNFRGGARPAVGDLNGDWFADLVVSAGEGGGPRVAGYDGTSLRVGQEPRYLFDDFFVFEPQLRNGAYLAVGDLNGDGKAEIAAGAGPGGGPRVYILNGASLLSNQLQPVANFFDGDVNARGGVTVSLRDVDGDSKPDLITGSGIGTMPSIRAYKTAELIITTGNPTPFLNTNVFDDAMMGGVYVG